MKIKNKEIAKNEKGLLIPKTDVVFQALFGVKGSERILGGFLSKILNQEVKKVSLDANQNLVQETVDEKLGILDLRAIIEENIDVNIEIQLVDKDNLEKDKAKVISVKADQEVKRAQLSALQEKKQSEINKLSVDEKAKQAELDAYNAKLKEIDDAIAEALRKAQEEEKKNNATNGGNGSSFDGTFAWPLDYSPRRVTSRMKYRWGRWHKGIDIGTNAEIGKRVIAAASGTVIYSAYQAGSSSSAGYGNYLIIYHGNGYCSLYAHMNSKAVSTGQRVSQGQLIGYSGNTGGVAPHLHFEIRKATSIGDFFGNNWKDPLDYLPGGYTIVD